MRLKEVVQLQTDYVELLKSGMTKKKLCDLVIPFRDKWGLTDKQALMIARNELPLQEATVLMSEWIPSTERLPKNFVSVLGYIPSAAPFPTVRECYTIHDRFFFPALDASYSAKAVTHWRDMPGGPKDGDT